MAGYERFLSGSLRNRRPFIFKPEPYAQTSGQTSTRKPSAWEKHSIFQTISSQLTESTGVNMLPGTSHGRIVKFTGIIVQAASTSERHPIATRAEGKPSNLQTYFNGCSFGSGFWLAVGSPLSNSARARRRTTPPRIKANPTPKSPAVSGRLERKARVIFTQIEVQVASQKRKGSNLFKFSSLTLHSQSKRCAGWEMQWEIGAFLFRGKFQELLTALPDGELLDSAEPTLSPVVIDRSGAEAVILGGTG
jgi:hypothetical protein